MSRHAGRLAVTVVLLGCLAACTDGDGADRADSTQRQISPTDLPEVPELAEPTGARDQLVLDDCPVGSGPQQVRGRFTNTADEAVDVVVTISWTNDGADVLGRAVGRLEEVGAAQEAPVELQGRVAEGVSRCVVNVRVGSLED